MNTLAIQNAELRNLLQRAILLMDDLRPSLDALDRIDRLTFDVARLSGPIEDVEPSSDDWTTLPCGARVLWRDGHPAEVDDGAALADLDEGATGESIVADMLATGWRIEIGPWRSSAGNRAHVLAAERVDE